MSVFLPLEWEDKVNSPELLAFLQQYGAEHYLSAEDINQLRNGVNELFENQSGGGSDSRPYKVFSALISQIGTNAPTAVILENTIGDIWFTYYFQGIYYANSESLFTTGKTWGVSDSVFDGTTPTNLPVVIDNSGTYGADSPFQVGIRTIGGDFNGDSLLINTPIEIRVYN